MPELFEDSVGDVIDIEALVSQVAGPSALVEVIVGIIDKPEDFVRKGFALSDALELGDEAATTLGILVSERLAVQGALAPAVTYNRLLAEAAQISEALYLGAPITASDVMTLETALSFSVGWFVAEQIGLTDTLAAMATFTQVESDAIAIQVAAMHFLGADLAEVVTIAPELLATSRLPSAAADGVQLSTTVTPALILRVTAESEVAIAPEELLRLVYAGQLDDTVTVEAMQVDPSGGIVTWAVNTRMGFTTQYSGYDFNSFARLGRVHVGATSEGLYELTGPDDDGRQIIAEIASGLLQMNSTRFTGLKGAYIGLRGGGRFLLKLVDGAGNERVYQITARDMETTKVNIGKGLRHRYISYALEAIDGQDFELESIEFVPMRASRRV